MVFLVLCGIFIFRQNSQENSTLYSEPDVASVSLESSPDLFYQLTMPYLKNRTYSSLLSSLNQLSESSTYTSYLTSYNSDGLTINALLTKPKTPQPSDGYPAIVFVHGYIQPKQYRTLEKYEAYVDYLAKNGFVVFKIDLRGHGDSQGEASGAYYSSDYVIDTLNAYAALQNTDFINKNKIGLWGHSMAGNVTFRAFVAKQSIPALVIWAGAGYTYEDLVTYRISDGSYQPPSSASATQQRRRLLFDAHGSFTATNSFWRQVPATNYLDGVKGAIQLNHSIDDSVVNIEYSRNLSRILDSTSIAHELHEYQSGGHNISGSSFTQAMQNTVAFFKKYLTQ